MNKISLIIKKELFRVFSDRKLIFSLYILPVLIMFAIYGIMGKMIGSMEKDITEHTAIVTVVDATEELKSAIDFSGFSGNANINYIDSAAYETDKDTIVDNIKHGKADLCVIVPKNFDEQVEDYVNGGSTLPNLEVSFNDSENYSSQAYSMFTNSVLGTYKNQLLGKRYGDVRMLEAMSVTTVILTKDEQSNSQFMKMLLPYMVVLMLFAGVMSVGVDAIAGEKERGTLSSMLISPVKRSEIAIGKIVSMAILSSISAAVTTVSMLGAFVLMGSSGGFAAMSGGVSFSPLQIIELLLIMLSLVILYVGIIALIAVYSPNTKAASSIISPLYPLIIIMGMLTMFRTGKETPTIHYAVPVYGNALAISDICSNELSLLHFFISFACTLIIGIVITVLVTKAFNDEKLMFNA
ncbi:MAG: ABC transporter permease [Lachnospiraceae bacterium]|nr:ABC transporter permease [Lachnospiraceae bacterium]